MKRIIILAMFLLMGSWLSAQVQLTSIKKSMSKWDLPIYKRELSGQTGYFQDYGTLQELMDSVGIVVENIDSLKYNPTTDSLTLYTSVGVYKTLIPGSTGTVKGTGTATRVAWWAGSDSLSSSSNLYWDNTNNRFGINTSTPLYTFTVNAGLIAFPFMLESATSDRTVLYINNTNGGDPMISYAKNGSAAWSIGYEDNGSTNQHFKIKRSAASMEDAYGTTRFQINGSTGVIRISSLDTDGAPPTTSGTTKMIISDANGDLSFTNIPSGGIDSTIITPGWGIDVTESPANTFTVTADTSQLATQDDIHDLVREARTISTTAPLQGGGDLSANRTFSITQATTSTDGYINSTDWNLFNAKPSGSGSSGRVAWWDATSNLTSDPNLYWDTSNDRLGIGTTSPSANLHVTGNVRIEGGSGTPTTIMGRSSIGLVNQVSLGTGFSITSGILNYTESGLGTVTSIATTNGITGGTITTTGTVQLTGQASAFHNLSSNGFAVRTSSGNVSARTMAAGTGMSITNGDGVSGNPTFNVTNPLPSGSSSQTLAYLSGAWTASSFLKTNSSSTTSGNSKRVTINDDVGGESWPLSIHTATKFLVNGRVQMNSTASTAVTSIMGRNDNMEVGNVALANDMELTSGVLTKKQVLGVLARSSGSASFSTSSTPAKLDFNQAMVTGVNSTASTANDDIVTTVSSYGAYEITCDCQFNAGSTATYNFGIYVNGSLNGSLVKQIPMTSGNTHDVVITGYVSSLATTDEVDIRVSTTSGTSGNTIGRCLLALKGI